MPSMGTPGQNLGPSPAIWPESKNPKTEKKNRLHSCLRFLASTDIRGMVFGQESPNCPVLGPSGKVFTSAASIDGTLRITHF